MRASIAVAAILLLAAAPIAAQDARPVNPFEPLTGEEISSAIRILKAQGKASEATRYTTITLQEPAKEAVLAGTGPFHRAASIVAYEYNGNKSFEGVVDLTTGTVASWKDVPGVQAQAMADDVEQLNQVLRGDSRWRMSAAATE